MSGRISFLLLSLLFPFLLTAQTPAGDSLPLSGKVTGRIVDPRNNPVPYATLSLLNASGKLVGGGLSQDNGSFQIETKTGGAFTLRIGAFGFSQKEIPDIRLTSSASTVQLGRIGLTEPEQQLKDVVVSSKKPLTEVSIDKKVFDVAQNITSAGGTAADVLQNVPSVTVDADGNVSLRGNAGVNVLIDGKPATLLGTDAASALQSLPAGSIQSVEVITNPSARYDAQGMGGIINIITKKDKKFGMNGSVTLGGGTRDKYNAAINLNLRNKRWNFFLNNNSRYGRNYNHVYNYRRNPSDTVFYAYEDNVRRNGGSFTTAGAELTIDERNVVTLTENVNFMLFGGDGFADYRQLTPSGYMYARENRDFVFDVMPFSHGTNLDFRHKFAKPKHELGVSLNYSRFEATRNQTYASQFFDGSESATTGIIRQYSPGTGSNSSFTGQADYTLPLFKNGKLDAGVKTQLLAFETTNHPTIDTDYRQSYFNLALLANFRYRQDIHAAYVNLADQRGKWGYQAGLRVEDAVYSGSSDAFSTVTGTDSIFKNNFLNLFPSAYLSYQIAPQRNIYLSYTRRTNRPGFMQLMPFKDLSNPQDVSIGNPDLKPEFINNIELSYNHAFPKNSSLFGSLYYQHTENLIDRYREFNPDGTTYTQPRNLASGRTYGAEVTGRAQLTAFWDAQLNVNAFYNQFDGRNVSQNLYSTGQSWFAKANTTVRLPKAMSVQLNANYEAPKVSAQSTLSEAWWLDLAVRKNLWKNKATLVLNISDLFDTHKYTILYSNAAYYQSIYRDRETRIANLTFTYRFGASDSKNRQRRPQGNGERERNNLRSEEGGDQGGF